jgi:predicted RNA binding protein YcfA (HicA-like mRNA interferase family)
MMMARLPRITGKELIKAMEKDGFVCKHIEGSHHIMQKEFADRKVTIPVPVHSGKILKLRTLNGILNKARISKEHLIHLL